MMSRERGFSLIEVLVAMLVLGVAVLAFAGLQVRSLESTGVAHTRSQAMTLAAEFVERMRANPNGLATYRLGPFGEGAYDDGNPDAWPNTCLRTAIANTGCDAVQMANFDVKEMQFIVEQMLPAGRMEIRDCIGGAVDIDCVFVSWGGVETVDCEDNSSPNCVSMRVFVE